MIIKTLPEVKKTLTCLAGIYITCILKHANEVDLQRGHFTTVLPRIARTGSEFH